MQKNEREEDPKLCFNQIERNIYSDFQYTNYPV